MFESHPNNPYDPNRDPFRFMAYEMKMNREAYLKNHPSERGTKSFQMRNFTDGKNVLDAHRVKTTTKKRRK